MKISALESPDGTWTLIVDSKPIQTNLTLVRLGEIVELLHESFPKSAETK